MRRFLAAFGLVSATLVTPLAVAGCDFGTLDDLSNDATATGSEELTAQARAVWNVYDKPDDSVRRAVVDLPGVLSRAEAVISDRPLKVKIGAITPDELATIGFQDKDYKAAQGMLVVPELDCTLDQVEKLVVAKNQTEIYPKLYDQYSRDYTSSVQDFLGRKTSTVAWHTQYTASAIGNTYVAQLTGGARRVPGAAPDGKDLLVARTYLNAPATFTTSGDAAFDQDYQIELYWERTPGKTLHFYALWRQFRIASLDASTDLYVALVLGNLIDFDVRTSKVCREGAPQAKLE